MPGVGPGRYQLTFSTGETKLSPQWRHRRQIRDVGCCSYLGSHLWQVRLELSPAWTQISVALIRSLNSLNLYSEEEHVVTRVGHNTAGLLHPAQLFICQSLTTSWRFSPGLAGWLAGWLQINCNEWRLDWTGLNHILMLSLKVLTLRR